MATLDSVKAKIQSLIAKANAKTGRSDANMTSAVNALVSGYNPNGITPSGTINITANGTHNVSAFEKAQVAVPVGTTPSGSINIEQNGTFNVEQYAKAVVNVPTPNQIAVVRTITLSADVTGAPTTHPLLTGDEFIKKHYSHTGFSATLIALNPATSATGIVHFSYQGNRNIGSANKTQTGVGLRSSSASAIGLVGLTTAINGSGYGQHMRVNSSGNLYQYLHTNYILKAGTYMIILTCTD